VSLTYFSNTARKLTHLGKLLSLPLFILLLSAIISQHFIAQAEQQNTERTEQKMSQRLQQISAEIAEKVTLYQYGLRGIRSAVLSPGVDNLNYPAILNYSASRDIEVEFPGARGFGVIRNIAKADLAKFLQSANAERTRQFKLQNLDSPVESFFIIQYIEPEVDNYSAIGLNIGSERMRRTAALNAARQNSVQLTAPITLVQALQKSQQGLLLLMPIYQQGRAPSSEQERIDQLFGWSYAPLLVNEVLHTVSGVNEDISLSITDITDASPLPFFNYGSTDSLAAAKPVNTTLNLYGRIWQLSMAAQPSFIAGLQLRDTKQLLRQYLVISFLLTLVVFSIQILLIRRRQLAENKAQLITIKSEFLQAANAKLEQQVQQRTVEIARVSSLQRSIVNGTNYAVIATNIEGLITLFNPAAEQLLGYSAAEVVNKLSADLFHLPQEIQQQAEALSAVLETEITADFSVFAAKAKLGKQDQTKWTYVRKDGSYCPVKLRLTALTNDHNKLVGFLVIAEDLTEREKLEFELELTRVSIEQAADPMFWLDANANILKANPAAHRIFGNTNLIQRSMLTVEHDSHLEQWQQLREQLHQQTEVRFNRNYKTDRGNIIPVSVTATLLEFAKQEYIYLVARDISVQQQREQELASARDNADTANKSKSAFLANMSHEIRTPMNAILGLLQLVQQSELDKRQRDYIEKTQVASQALLEILNDILDFSKVEAGKLELELHRFSLTTLMHDLAVILAASAADKKIEILYDIATDIPDMLIGDALRIKQILINLAGNAIKFTQQGEVIITVKAHLNSADAIELIISVKDTGIGMEPKQLGLIFSGFEQAESSISRRFGGTGLGLAISKRLIELMHGTIRVNSTPNVGSVFTVTMQLKVAQEQSTVAALVLPQQLRLLVVDDNQQARLIMTNIVESFAWSCTAVDTGAAALLAIESAIEQQQKYDIVLLDWHMPDVNGLQVAEAIQHKIAADDKPLVIMVSAYSKDVFSYRSENVKQLIDGFIMKPMTRTLLAQTLNDIYHTDTTANSFQPHDSAGSHPLKGINLLLVEDNATNQLVASELLRQQGATVEIASSGQQALAILAQQPAYFSVVLMDIQMPEMDGYETTQHIRQQLKLTDLPIIAMTANAMTSDIKACLAAGMQDHVAKPFNLTELTNKVLQHSSQALSASTAITTNPSPAFATLPIAVQQYAAQQHIELNQALQQLGNSAEFYCKVLQQFRQDVMQYQLQLSTKKQSSSQQQLIFHSLKSTAAMLGFQPLAITAGNYEQQLKLNPVPVTQAQLEVLVQQLITAQQQSTKIMQFLLPDLQPVAPSLSLQQLTENVNLLQSQLDSANMAAINLFERLKPSLLQLEPQLVTLLADAMATLSFGPAGQLLQQLKHILDRQANDS
jgi:PAS domain S-box-containing protein